ncbi:hypothetical protein I3842_05G093200 [Carya illinoinensis]|uniref:Uncharacterized protein n=1 Tax=Carya illinoinensis TaxID=32201 RepID=A0A922EXL9_CARIL|nr:hypothetical protein I3842_05G093200 [Carya illinoinensis]
MGPDVKSGTSLQDSRLNQNQRRWLTAHWLASFQISEHWQTMSTHVLTIFY